MIKISNLLISTIALLALGIFAVLMGEKDKAVIYQARPVVVTDTTPNDTDDPAIWYNRNSPGNSLILGTDKGDSTGGIFVFNLEGKLLPELCQTHLSRPNNIDIEYGFSFHDSLIDIAAFTERGKNLIRILSLPDCKFIDNGGIPVFEDDSIKQPMGIALFKDHENSVFAFVGRKSGPLTGYIYQYKLFTNGSAVCAEKVRSFGKYSGLKEIEAIAVDDELGYVYYSDETAGIRKYYANAGRGNEELAFFGQTGFTQDQEGISIVKKKHGKGYIIISDQQANEFRIFNRKGALLHPHRHQLIRIVKTATTESDGSDILNFPLNNNFRKGIFVAMSSDKTFQYYRAENITGEK